MALISIPSIFKQPSRWALWAMVVHVLMPTLMLLHTAWQTAPRSLPADIICTVWGIKPLTKSAERVGATQWPQSQFNWVAEDGVVAETGNAPTMPSHDKHCPWCVLQAAPGLWPTITPTVSPPLTLLGVRWHTGPVWLSVRFGVYALSRAPPSFS